MFRPAAVRRSSSSKARRCRALRLWSVRLSSRLQTAPPHRGERSPPAHRGQLENARDDRRKRVRSFARCGARSAWRRRYRRRAAVHRASRRRCGTGGKLDRAWRSNDASSATTVRIREKFRPSCCATSASPTSFSGHSERRAYCGETDAGVNAKVKAALDSRELRRSSQSARPTTNTSPAARCKRSRSRRALPLPASRPSDVARCVVAYEPIWAIGSGLSDEPESANGVMGEIRACVDGLAARAHSLRRQHERRNAAASAGATEHRRRLDRRRKPVRRTFREDHRLRARARRRKRSVERRDAACARKGRSFWRFSMAGGTATTVTATRSRRRAAELAPAVGDVSACAAGCERRGGRPARRRDGQQRGRPHQPRQRPRRSARRRRHQRIARRRHVRAKTKRCAARSRAPKRTAGRCI